MAIGMSYDLFWYGDIYAIRQFEKAHELRNEMLNQQMWVNGLYTLNALQSVVSTALGKRTKYLEKPLNLKPNTDAEKQREKAITVFEQMRLAWGRKGQSDGR